MSTTYAQRQTTAQKKDASSASSVLDNSSQSESLQRKADMANNAAQRAEAPRPNNTGMPDNLKSGIESLSGFSMDDVRVHYNSSKPATVQALAYTQGTDIHVAPGQEKHLPHEAWHVAQQMAGRVSPTTNINGMPVNDNAALEHEADVMGEKAVQCKGEKDSILQLKVNLNPVFQLAVELSTIGAFGPHKTINLASFVDLDALYQEVLNNDTKSIINGENTYDSILIRNMMDNVYKLITGSPPSLKSRFAEAICSAIELKCGPNAKNKDKEDAKKNAETNIFAKTNLIEILLCLQDYAKSKLDPIKGDHLFNNIPKAIKNALGHSTVLLDNLNAIRERYKTNNGSNNVDANVINYVIALEKFKLFVSRARKGTKGTLHDLTEIMDVLFNNSIDPESKEKIKIVDKKDKDAVIAYQKTKKTSRVMATVDGLVDYWKHFSSVLASDVFKELYPES